MSIRKTAATAAAAMILAVATAGMAFAADFTGKWKTTDTAGKAFEITLMKDGSAQSTQGKGYKGKWTEEGDAAVIKWDTGWTTKIAKSGEGYMKTAYEKGASMDGKPTNEAKAEKAE